MDSQNCLSISNDLILLLREPVNIQGDRLNNAIFSTFSQCLARCFSNADATQVSIFEIDSILDYLHDELNTGHWSEVPLKVRRNFTLASFVKLIFLLRDGTQSREDLYQECVKCIDIGLLLGAPLQENPELLAECARFLRNKIKITPTDSCIVIERKELHQDREIFEQLSGTQVFEEQVPSLETFNNKYFSLQIPVKLKGCMEHWPAKTKWTNLQYLMGLAGNRTVPIEIGSHYTDEDWSQKLMTLDEFIKKYFLSDTGDIGYLAQHNLFEQITELKEDIRIPEYCCCSLNFEESTEPDINAWLGPKGTVSPLHQDPKNNILAQVFGTKQILLYSTENTSFVYPYRENMLSNTARVDPLKPNYLEYPEFRKAKMYKCYLEPGDMLFIPVKWWHHVTALDKSFSVSFWWK